MKKSIKMGLQVAYDSFKSELQKYCQNDAIDIYIYLFFHSNPFLITHCRVP